MSEFIGLWGFALAVCASSILAYRYGFVDGAESCHKLGLEEVKRRFNASKWRIGV